MSKQQEKILRVVSGIITVAFAFGVTYGAMQGTRTRSVSNEASCKTNTGDIRELKTDIKWLIESGKRIEEKLAR